MRNRRFASSGHLRLRSKKLQNKGSSENSCVHRLLRPRFLMQHARFAMLKQCNIAQSLRLPPFKMELGSNRKVVLLVGKTGAVWKKL